MNKNKKNRKGFTIVELVIVIAVIGILATVLVPTFGDIIGKANNSADLQAAKNAYTDYLIDHAAEGKDDFVIQGKTKFFIVVDGQMMETPYADVDKAVAAFPGTTGDAATHTVTKGTADGKVTPVTYAAKS